MKSCGIGENGAFDLKNTVELMCSDVYEKRFEAEYVQLGIRRDQLARVIRSIEDGTVEFMPACPLELLKRQLKAMSEYLHCMKLRAEAEGVEV